MAVRHDANPNALIAAQKREAAKPGRDKTVGRGSGLTPRVRKAIDLMIFGDDTGKFYPSDREAAEAAGLSVRSLRTALLKPSVEAYHRRQLIGKRNGLKALALHTIEDVMTDVELKKTAAGAKVRVDAAKTSLHEPVGNQIQVNTQVNVNGHVVTPGYVIRIDRTNDTKTAQQIEHLGSEDVFLIDAAADDLEI